MKKRSAAIGFLAILAMFASPNKSSESRAGITGYITVRNSRNESIRVLVNWGFRGTVEAHSSRSFLVGDAEDATTWVSAERQGGYELKRQSFSGPHTDESIWVD